MGKKKNSIFGLGNLVQNIASTHNVSFGYGGWCVTFKGMQQSIIVQKSFQHSNAHTCQ
jgi:hypothetical protein